MTLHAWRCYLITIKTSCLLFILLLHTVRVYWHFSLSIVGSIVSVSSVEEAFCAPVALREVHEGSQWG